MTNCRFRRIACGKASYASSSASTFLRGCSVPTKRKYPALELPSQQRALHRALVHGFKPFAVDSERDHAGSFGADSIARNHLVPSRLRNGDHAICIADALREQPVLEATQSLVRPLRMDDRDGVVDRRHHRRAPQPRNHVVGRVIEIDRALEPAAARRPRVRDRAQCDGDRQGDRQPNVGVPWKREPAPGHVRSVDAFDRKTRALDVREQRFGIGADTVETTARAREDRRRLN